MIKFKDKNPRNPQHFIALCYMRTKVDQTFKAREDVCTLVFESGNVGLFECSYGFFLVHKKTKKVLVNEFFETKAAAIKVLKIEKKKEG